ncbi:MAG TPA: DUF2510 domain-containing protein, partial [Ilumatobacteraceae bacterium]
GIAAAPSGRRARTPGFSITIAVLALIAMVTLYYAALLDKSLRHFWSTGTAFTWYLVLAIVTVVAVFRSGRGVLTALTAWALVLSVVTSQLDSSITERGGERVLCFVAVLALVIVSGVATSVELGATAAPVANAASVQPAASFTAPTTQTVSTIAAASQPAANGTWAADPYRRHQLRFWDGVRWTEHVSDNGVAGVDPPA